MLFCLEYKSNWKCIFSSLFKELGLSARLDVEKKLIKKFSNTSNNDSIQRNSLGFIVKMKPDSG